MQAAYRVGVQLQLNLVVINVLEAIKRYIGMITGENLDAIATKFGELAANEQLKGWCAECNVVTREE